MRRGRQRRAARRFDGDLRGRGWRGLARTGGARNAAARAHSPAHGRCRRRRRRARTRAVGSGQRRPVAHVVRRSATALSERGTRDAVGRRLPRRQRAVPTAPLRRASGAGAWQPRGDGTLTSGSGVESGDWQVGPLVSVFRIKNYPQTKIAQNR
jgi:hypothetical protein